MNEEIEETNEIDETEERVNISHTCLTYYKHADQLAYAQKQLDKLLKNPIIYTGQNNVYHLQGILDYAHELEDLKNDVEYHTEQLPLWAADIVQIFKGIGIPPHTKIKAYHVGYSCNSNIWFWYDEEDKVSFEVVRVR